jgi:hypothetical protein
MPREGDSRKAAKAQREEETKKKRGSSVPLSPFEGEGYAKTGLPGVQH